MGRAIAVEQRISIRRRPGNEFAAHRATGAGATIWIGNSTVSGNENGLHAQIGGAIRSYATNTVNGNANDGAASSTVVMK